VADTGSDAGYQPGRDADRLARALLEILTKSAAPSAGVDKNAEPETPSDEFADAVDRIIAVDVEALPPRRAVPRPDLCAMAVMLGRELDRVPGLVAALRYRSPKVSIKTNSLDDIDLVIEVLEKGVFPNNLGLVNPGSVPRRDQTYIIFGSAAPADQGAKPWVVDAALLAGPPLVLVSRDPAADYSTRVWRSLSHRLTLKKIDRSCLDIVIETITGQPSAIDIAPDILDKLDFADCALAIRPERSPIECQEALIAEVESRSPRASGPLLEALHGYGAAKPWGLEVVSDIRALRDGTLTWDAFPNRALLLAGPPGSGKTAFAAALARSAGVPLLASSVADWNAASNLSGTLAAMKSTFQAARQSAPCILLIDELDGISKRSRLSGHHVEYWQQIVNLLLELLDGSERNDGVVVIGATNFPEMIDEALLRSGRIDCRIDIPKPDLAGLVGIFGFYLGDSFDRSTVNLFARAALGRTGADCEVFVRRAKANARRQGRPLNAGDLLNAIGHDDAGVPAEARRRAAVHEAGHAVVALGLGFAAIESLSIAGGGGDARLGPIGPVYTAQSCKDHLAVAMAGRAAEELVFGTIGSGGGGQAKSDLAIATRIAVAMELQLGLGELGLPYMDVDLPDAAGVPGLLPTVRRHLDDAMDRASALLIEQRGFLDRLSAELYRTGVLLDDDIQTIASACRSTGRLH
jgi:hypothetical protein